MVDVDGVVSPVGGQSAWGDDVHTGDVFGPVTVSPSLCEHLDQINALPNVQCWWLTSWTASMRAQMRIFPGRDWPVLADPENPTVFHQAALLFDGKPWWKWEAINRLVRSTPLAGLVWCDDHLAADQYAMRLQPIQKALDNQGLPSLLICPRTDVGVTPAHVATITAWVMSRAPRSPEL